MRYASPFPIPFPFPFPFHFPFHFISLGFRGFRGFPLLWPIVNLQFGFDIVLI